MDDSLLSFTIIFAELGGLLLLVLITGVIYFIYNAKKDGETSMELVKHVKSMLLKHRANLINHFKDDMAHEENKADSNVDTLMKSEKKLYEHLINVSINKDTSFIKISAKLTPYLNLI